MADFSTLYGSLGIAGPRAANLLSHEFSDVVELLPTISRPDGQYWVMNVTSTSDLMDAERTDATWHEPGRFASIDRLAICDDYRDDPPAMFRLRNNEVGFSFVTGAFAQAVSRAGLTGLDLREVTA